MPLYDALNEQLHPLPPALAAAFISSLLLPRAYVPTYLLLLLLLQPHVRRPGADELGANNGRGRQRWPSTPTRGDDAEDGCGCRRLARPPAMAKHANDGRGRQRWPSTPTMGAAANDGRARQRRAIAPTMGAAADDGQAHQRWPSTTAMAEHANNGRDLMGEHGNDGRSRRRWARPPTSLVAPSPSSCVCSRRQAWPICEEN